MNIPKYIIVHHFGGTDANPKTDTSNQTFQVVDSWHKYLWGFRSSLGYYCGYHYVIEKDGKITQARADNEAGAHCIGHNQDSIGVSLAGNFDITDPTSKQIAVLKAFLVQKAEQYSIPLSNIVPHRVFATYKSCYGTRLKNEWARNLVSDYFREKLGISTQIDLLKGRLLDLYRTITAPINASLGAISEIENREA